MNAESRLEGGSRKSRRLNRTPREYDEEPSLRQRLADFDANFVGVRWYLIELYRAHRGREDCACNGCERWSA